MNMIVLVVGMHRSGTSALAGMLHSNGIIMGEDGMWHPPPMKENPKGFFENKVFRNINDVILMNHGYKVKSFDPAVPTMNMGLIRAETIGQMISLIEEYDAEFEHWGWKDPRTCLTLPIWLEVMDRIGIEKNRLRVLIPYRPPEDVAGSMLGRGNKEKLYQGQFKDLSVAYHKAVLYACEGRVDYKIIDYQSLMFEPKDTAQLITEFTGIPITDTSHIDPGLADRQRVANG